MHVAARRSPTAWSQTSASSTRRASNSRAAQCIAKLDAGDLTGAQQLLDFSLARFQGLSGQSGGTLLTEDLMTMMRLRERVVDPTATARVRKAFAYLAAYAQRGAHSTPVENERLRR